MLSVENSVTHQLKMFARSENYFMETTVSFGILTICSDWSLCTMFLPQYALRLLICLPNGAGGEILCWAVGSWRAGTMSYSSCILHSTNSSKGVDKYWMKESWYTWPHCLIPGITYQHPIISILLPCFIFFWAIITSCPIMWLLLLFIISLFPTRI